jgi:hypothetical protein
LTEVGVQAFGSALVAVDDFYGYVDGGLSAILRYAFSDRDWISLRVVPLEYRFSANASIEASRYDTGASAMSYHHTFPLSRIVSIAPYLRVLVPSDTAYQHAVQYGIEHGVSVAALPTTWLAFSGGLSLPSYFVVNGARSHTTFVPNLSWDAALMATRWLSFVLGAGTRIRSGRQSGFESFDPRFATRFYWFDRLRIELGAATPLFGADRTDVALVFDTAWVF